jgi:Zn finger protein HypA/HybF involved in hydrogenase expression
MHDSNHLRNVAGSEHMNMKVTCKGCKKDIYIEQADVRFSLFRDDYYCEECSPKVNKDILTEAKTVKCPWCNEEFDLEVTVSSDKVGNLRTIGVEYKVYE